jgi:2-polyprenyl-3-methyl-5-hydroxy-6-metoxy-1,4-benzoquinol methylase
MTWPAVICVEDGEVLVERDATLACPRGHSWPLENGIPRMVANRRTYADAFGLQWNVYRKTQLDSHTGTTISRDRARRCLGEACWTYLHEHSGAQVLEVGCGAGRFTEVLLSTGARVTSIDLSEAVDANQLNCRQDDRHRILQADALRIPFAAGQFDVVFCLGVVQHTPSPEDTIGRLFEQVAPGGWLVFDHYTHDLSHYTRVKPLFRAVLRRLSPPAGLRWTERLVRWSWPAHVTIGRNRLGHALLSRVSPVSSYCHTLPLPDALQFEWALLDTHDSLTDRYKHLRSRGWVERVLRDIGAEDIDCVRGGNGVEARCRRGSRGRT